MFLFSKVLYFSVLKHTATVLKKVSTLFDLTMISTNFGSKNSKVHQRRNMRTLKGKKDGKQWLSKNHQIAEEHWLLLGKAARQVSTFFDLTIIAKHFGAKIQSHLSITEEKRKKVAESQLIITLGNPAKCWSTDMTTRKSGLPSRYLFLITH